MTSTSSNKPALRRLADGITLARGALGLPLLAALSLGWGWFAWGLLLLEQLQSIVLVVSV